LFVYYDKLSITLQQGTFGNELIFETDVKSDYFATSFISMVGWYLPVLCKIHQALLLHFSLLAEFLIGKRLVKETDSRVLKLVNLKPEYPLAKFD
jgi:hypothetical protein